MNERIFGYLYLTLNLANGRKYIGMRKLRHKNIEDDPYIGSGSIFRLALKKYGKENHKNKKLLYTFLLIKKI